MANETPLQHGPIRFGLFDWIESDKLLARDTFEERLKMLEYADEAEFFCYQLAEHHLTPLCLAPSPGIFLAAAAQRTRNIRLDHWSTSFPSTILSDCFKKSVCWTI